MLLNAEEARQLEEVLQVLGGRKGLRRLVDVVVEDWLDSVRPYDSPLEYVQAAAAWRAASCEDRLAAARAVLFGKAHPLARAARILGRPADTPFVEWARRVLALYPNIGNGAFRALLELAET